MTMPQSARRDLSRFRLALRDHSERANFYANWYMSDISEQGKKLMQMIGIAVNGLNNLDALVPAVEQLGVRHVGYGVQDSHYDTVGTALIWTLNKGLAEDFTPEVEAAWIEVYTLLAGVMKQAANTQKAS